MSQNDIQISIRGSGTQVYAYIIDDEILGMIRSNAENGYLDDPSDIVRDNCIESLLICNGIDLESDNIIITIKSDNDVIEKENILHVYEGYEEDNPDTFKEDLSQSILCFDDDITPSGFVDDIPFEIPEEMHVVIEQVEYHAGNLCGTINDISEKFCLENLRLKAVDLDTGSDLSAISYGLNLVNNIEKDIRAISYNGQISDLYLNFSGISNASYFLINRHDDGEWSLNQEGVFLLSNS